MYVTKLPTIKTTCILFLPVTRFRVSSMTYGCPMSRGKSIEIEAWYVWVYWCQCGIIASTKVGCIKITLACTVNTLYFYKWKVNAIFNNHCHYNKSNCFSKLCVSSYYSAVLHKNLFLRTRCSHITSILLSLWVFFCLFFLFFNYSLYICYSLVSVVIVQLRNISYLRVHFFICCLYCLV